MWRHRGARRLSRQKIAAPRNEIDFRPSEEGVSLVELIRRAAGCDEAQAQAVSGVGWLRRARGEVLTLEGIGILRHRAFTPEPAFAAQLNPAGEEVVTLQPRMNRAVVAIAVAAIVVAVAVFGYIEFAPEIRIAFRGAGGEVERREAESLFRIGGGRRFGRCRCDGGRTEYGKNRRPDRTELPAPDRPAGTGVCRNSAGGVCTTDRRHGINRKFHRRPPHDRPPYRSLPPNGCSRGGVTWFSVYFRPRRTLRGAASSCCARRRRRLSGSILSVRSTWSRPSPRRIAASASVSRGNTVRRGPTCGFTRKMSSPASLVTRAVDAFYWRRLEGVVSRQLFRYAFCGGMNLALDAVWYFVIYHFRSVKGG